MRVITSNMFHGADNPEIETGIEVLRNQNALPKVDKNIVTITSPEDTSRDNMKYYEDIVNHLKDIYQVYLDDKTKQKEILIGGDHSIALASVAHSLEQHHNLGVIWVDAHADINTHEITNSGNVHGMPVAALIGLGDKGLVDFTPRTKYLLPENIIYIGLRDVEPAEQAVLDDLEIKHYTADDVRTLGIEQVMNDSISYLKDKKVSNLHISYDIDSADPSIAPGVTTNVPDGLTLQETQHIFRELHESFNVVAIDVVEFNPVTDIDNTTVEFFKTLMPDVLR